MTSLALLLVLAAAVLHASWNYCAKRAGGGLPFVWLVGAIICTGYVVVLAIYAHVAGGLALPAGAIAWIAGSGVLKTSYSLFLQRGYRTGDFSLIYPVARGTGPLLSMIAAIVLLGERPSLLAFTGGAVTTAVAADVAVPGPPLLMAVTTERIVAPTSVAVSRYVAEVADAMLTQDAPALSHRCHW